MKWFNYVHGKSQPLKQGTKPYYETFRSPKGYTMPIGLKEYGGYTLKSRQYNEDAFKSPYLWMYRNPQHKDVWADKDGNEYEYNPAHFNQWKTSNERRLGFMEYLAEHPNHVRDYYATMPHMRMPSISFEDISKVKNDLKTD